MSAAGRREGGVRVRVFGLGHRYRGDDVVGLRVAERLRPRVPAGVDVRVLTGEPLDLIEAWAGLDLAVVVDSVRSGQAPGTLHRLEVGGADLPAGGAAASSHAFDLTDTVELARAIGILPRRLVVWGVEGARYGMGDAPTPEVMAAVPEAVDGVLEDVRRAVEEPAPA